jgi:hypothetical protein
VPGISAVHYLPIATTLLAGTFCAVLLRRYVMESRGAHLLWWAVGMLTYGLGTALESAIALGGNTIVWTKLWYIAGALLGGYPLAQGTVYLLAGRRLANRLTVVTLPVIAALAALVALSPVDVAALEPHRPSGAVLAWSWIRALTPLVNLYALAFLVGGAVQSALRYARAHGVGDRARALGNASIALGGLLPGIGGTLAKAGLVEALYVAELVGLVLIAIGFQLNVAAPGERRFRAGA